ncbi:unnamed protein product [Ilex paraguariensis]|uniref:Brf1 TBP-binding domain-containing protein n=1 Tax=Ilex paraguariensis TaxID=185542 RepID=A0ABC8QMP3_9AQUA
MDSELKGGGQDWVIGMAWNLGMIQDKMQGRQQKRAREAKKDNFAKKAAKTNKQMETQKELGPEGKRNKRMVSDSVNDGDSQLVELNFKKVESENSNYNENEDGANYLESHDTARDNDDYNYYGYDDCYANDEDDEY